jgi:hypothetical protein
MARSRNIKPAFFMNELLAGLAHWVRLLFAGLWTISDREGRLDDNPRRIGAAVFPYESGLQINDGLNQLDACGFIKRYDVGGKPFIQILAWDKHQNPHPKETASVIPPYLDTESNEQATDKPRLVTEMPRRTAEPPRNYTASDNCTDFSDIGKATEITRLVTEFPERVGLIPSNLIPDSLTLIPSPVARKQSAQQDTERVNAFEKFIARYPNKIGIDEACRQWISLVGNEITEATLPEVMAGLNRWIASEQWQKENGRYVPAPSKWLREKKWLDQPKAAEEYVEPAPSSAGTNANAEWRPPWSKEPVAA